jgi:hypothetical protein
VPAVPRLLIFRLSIKFTLIKLVPNDGEDDVLPDTVGYTFSKTNNPFSTRDVKRVFPNRSSDTGVKEKVVCCWGE